MSNRVAAFSTGVLRQADEPHRLYEAPASLFVARFLGDSNALPATVQRHDGARGLALLGTGASVTATMPAVCASGSAVHLVVRPEKILLGTAAASDEGGGMSGVVNREAIQKALCKADCFRWRVQGRREYGPCQAADFQLDTRHGRAARNILELLDSSRRD